MNNPKQIIKAINRRVRRQNFFAGGRQYGVDYSTWVACYPQMASVFSAAAEQIVGRSGRYMPRFQ